MPDPALITALIALVTALGGAIGGLVKGRRDGADIARQATEAAQEFWAKTVERQDKMIDRQAGEIEELRSRVQAMEEADPSRAELIAHVESMHSWAERGAKPPPPKRPTWSIPGPFSPLHVDPEED